MTTSATQQILAEEGVDVALADLAAKVHAAAQAIREFVQAHPGEDWTALELQDAAARDFSPSVRSLAFLRLLQADVLTLGSDLRVRAS